jgi:small subunit ribosomal protein S3
VGQKIHPVGMRLGITRTWDSRWFEKKHYVDWLHEDIAIRKSFNRWMRSASISKIEIERRANQARVIVNTAKPGIIIGKRGVGIDEIRKNLELLTHKSVAVNVMEIAHPELDARLVAQNIVDQLEKRIAFRRAMKQSIMRTMRAGARGIKVQVSGRLGGAEIARTEHNADGKVPLHTLRADIDYAQVEAFTTFGRIGVKVWIYRGEVLPDQPRTDGGQRDRSDRNRDRRDRGGRPRREAPRMQPAGAPAQSAPEPTLAPAEPVTELAAAPPEAIAPEVTAPEMTAPEVTAPEATAPEATAPEATAPGATAPEATAPEATAPEVSG